MNLFKEKLHERYQFLKLHKPSHSLISSKKFKDIKKPKFEIYFKTDSGPY